MTEKDLEVGKRVRTKDGKQGYLLDWFLATGGKTMGVVCRTTASLNVGWNIPIDDLEEVKE